MSAGLAKWETATSVLPVFHSHILQALIVLKNSISYCLITYLILDVPRAKYEVWEGTSLVTWLSHGEVVSPEKKAAMSH